MKVTAEGEGEEWQKRKEEEIKHGLKISEYNNVF